MGTKNKTNIIWNLVEWFDAGEKRIWTDATDGWIVLDDQLIRRTHIISKSAAISQIC